MKFFADRTAFCTFIANLAIINVYTRNILLQDVFEVCARIWVQEIDLCILGTRS